MAGVLVRPRRTLAELVISPAWAAPWAVILTAWVVCAAWLLNTDVGQQALVDERVRVAETFGGQVSDVEYSRWQASPAWWVYFVSGSRLLLAPPATLAAAVAVWLVARRDDGRARFRQALAITVHATIVLVVGQLVGTPFHYLRESLTSPSNLAALLPLVADGTLVAQFLGSLDVFVLWWAGLIAVGLSALTRRRVSRYAWPLLALVAVVAGALAAVVSTLQNV
jgi:hypothetical protein